MHSCQSAAHISASWRCIRGQPVYDWPVPSSILVLQCAEKVAVPLSLPFPSPIQTGSALQHVNKLLIHQCAQRGRASQGPARLALSGSDSLHNLGERHKRWATPNVLWDTVYTARQLQPRANTGEDEQYTQPDAIFNLSFIIFRLLGGNQERMEPNKIRLEVFVFVLNNFCDFSFPHYVISADEYMWETACRCCSVHERFHHPLLCSSNLDAPTTPQH